VLENGIIQLSYCQFINARHSGSFEKAVREHSYEEFLLKSQAYNPGGRFRKFTEMVAADGRANSLHYKTSFVIDPWIGLLKNKIPRFSDHAGKPIPFDTYRFELIESDLDHFELHEVTIHYITPPFIWLATIGDSMVLSKADSSRDSDGFVSCLTISMEPGLSILKIKYPDSQVSLMRGHSVQQVG
jgi:hypothetical protein